MKTVEDCIDNFHGMEMSLLECKVPLYIEIVPVGGKVTIETDEPSEGNLFYMLHNLFAKWYAE